MKTQIAKTVTRDESTQLFTIPCHGGYSCLGFEVCERRCVALSRELAHLGYSLPAPATFGSLERYTQYAERQELARQHCARTGYRFHCDLCPQLSQYQGQLVEVVDNNGERRRFRVGKSTGWIPCHLEIKGNSKYGDPAELSYKSVRPV